MFHAVRDWWLGGRGKMTARLFVFELVVVILGVLIAQGLANWANERERGQQVTKEYARLRFETGRARQAAMVWQAAIPCLRERSAILVRAASAPSGGALLERDIAMPLTGTYSVEPITLDVERAFRDRYGDDVTDLFGGLNRITSYIADENREIVAEWGTFGYLAPDMAPLDERDRAAIRAAHIRLRYLLNRVDDRTQRVIADADRLGVAPVGSGRVLAIPDNPVTSCAEIWRNGHVWRTPR